MDNIFTVGQEFFALATDGPDLFDKKCMKSIALLSNTIGLNSIYQSDNKVLWMYESQDRAKNVKEQLKKYGVIFDSGIIRFIIDSKGTPRFKEVLYVD